MFWLLGFPGKISALWTLQTKESYNESSSVYFKNELRSGLIKDKESHSLTNLAGTLAWRITTTYYALIYNKWHADLIKIQC